MGTRADDTRSGMLEQPGERLQIPVDYQTLPRGDHGGRPLSPVRQWAHAFFLVVIAALGLIAVSMIFSLID